MNKTIKDLSRFALLLTFMSTTLIHCGNDKKGILLIPSPDEIKHLPKNIGITPPRGIIPRVGSLPRTGTPQSRLGLRMLQSKMIESNLRALRMGVEVMLLDSIMPEIRSIFADEGKNGVVFIPSEKLSITMSQSAIDQEDAIEKSIMEEGYERDTNFDEGEPIKAGESIPLGDVCYFESDASGTLRYTLVILSDNTKTNCQEAIPYSSHMYISWNENKTEVIYGYLVRASIFSIQTIGIFASEYSNDYNSTTGELSALSTITYASDGEQFDSKITLSPCENRSDNNAGCYTLKATLRDQIDIEGSDDPVPTETSVVGEVTNEGGTIESTIRGLPTGTIIRKQTFAKDGTQSSVEDTVE